MKFTSLSARPIFQGKRLVRAFQGVKNNTSNLRHSEMFCSEKREKASLTFEIRKVKVQFNLKQVTKAQRGSRVTALLFL